MPQNDKRSVKRRTRSERRAQEEARLRAEAEQAEKERKQQTLIGAIVVVVVIALIAVIGITVYRNTHPSSAPTATTSSASLAKAKKAMYAVKPKPSVANSDGGFTFSKDGYNKTISDAPTVAVYMDPMCPGCGQMHRQIDETLKSMYEAGQVNLEYHMMTSLDANSSDDYSSRASSSAVYIAQHDSNPEHLLQYMTNLYAEGFQPSEGSDYVPVSNDKLKEQAIKAGVPESVASKAYAGTYTKWLKAVDSYTTQRNELKNVSGSLKGQMSTPTVTINGKIIDMNKVASLNMSVKDAILNAIGLSESNVGKSGVMPSVSSKDKPKSIDTGE